MGLFIHIFKLYGFMQCRKCVLNGHLSNSVYNYETPQGGVRGYSERAEAWPLFSGCFEALALFEAVEGPRSAL